MHHDAVRWDDPELMERLLRAGCPVDIKNDRGDTPLAEAVRDGRVSAVRCLLNAGAARRHPGVMKTLSTLRRKYKHVS
jgi:ankyrin repeat protein